MPGQIHFSAHVIGLFASTIHDFAVDEQEDDERFQEIHPQIHEYVTALNGGQKQCSPFGLKSLAFCTALRILEQDLRAQEIRFQSTNLVGLMGL